jgi:cell division septation protein DedD
MPADTTPPTAASAAADRPEEDVTTTLYRAAIGPINTDYYLTRFSRFEAADRAGPSWNWAAGLCTLNWLAFRHLGSAALAYVGALVGLALMVFGIGSLVFQFSEGALLALALVFGALAFIVPGLFGTAAFHIQCRKRMAKALADHANIADACAALTAQASSRRRMGWLALINAMLLGAAVGVYAVFASLNALTHNPAALGEPRNVAVGRTTQAPLSQAPASEPAAALATPPAAPASALQAPPAALPAASAPASAASAASAALTPASAPAVAASAARPANAAPAGAAVAPLPAASAAAPASPSTATPAPPAAKAPDTDTMARKPAAQPSRSTAAARKRPPRVREPVANRRFFINAGLFAVDDNAASAHARLMRADLPAFTQVLETASGRRTRVRVGPFETYPEAQAAAQRVQSQGLNATIIQQ